MPIAIIRSLQINGKAYSELARRPHESWGPTLQHVCIKSPQDLSSGCLHDYVRWLHAKLFNFLVGIVWQRGRTTAQGRVHAAERRANSSVAGLDILAVDVDGWRWVYRLIKFEVLLQTR